MSLAPPSATGSNALKIRARNSWQPAELVGDPECGICRSRRSHLWAPSPLRETVRCSEDELRLARGCGRCQIILEGVRHFSRLFLPGIKHPNAMCEYDLDILDRLRSYEDEYSSYLLRITIYLGNTQPVIDLNLTRQGKCERCK